MNVTHKIIYPLKDEYDPRLCGYRMVSDPIPTDEELSALYESCTAYWKYVTCKKCLQIGATQGKNALWRP